MQKTSPSELRAPQPDPLVALCLSEDTGIGEKGKGIHYNAPMSFTVQGIDHVQVTCPPSKEAECIAFYRDVLALPEIEKPEDLKKNGGAWFQVGALQLHLGVDPEQETPMSKRHVCFLVDDLEAAEAALRAAGFEIKPEPIDAFGLRRFFTRDPAGTRVEMGSR